MFRYRLPDVDHNTLDLFIVLMALVSFCSTCISIATLIGDLSRFLQ